MTRTNHSAALLVLRLGLGITFLLHGLQKMRDISGTQQQFDGLGIPAPEVMAPFVAATETFGGALLILGLLTPVAGAALAINMLVAALTVHVGNGFFVGDGGYELVMVLGLGALALVLAGPGRFSLDAALDLPGRLLPQKAAAPTARTRREGLGHDSA
jgi:putative oxidoreductase